jgi:hypothetical protein
MSVKHTLVNGNDLSSQCGIRGRHLQVDEDMDIVVCLSEVVVQIGMLSMSTSLIARA